MEWNSGTMDRLFQLYERYFEDLRKEMVAGNRTLGSAEPDRIKLEQLNRDEFEAILRSPAADGEVLHAWIRKIISGNEREFPELSRAVGYRQIAG